MPASVRAVSSGLLDAVGSINVTKPTGAVSGDVLIACHSMVQGTLANMGTPTGGATWESLATRASGTDYDNKTKIWWKVAGGSEPANYGFTQNSSSTGVIAIAAVMGANTALTPVVAQTGNDAFSTSVPSPGITPAGDDDLELRWVSGQPDFETITWTVPATYTEEADLQAGGNSTGALASKQLTSGAATGSLNFTSLLTLGFRHGFTIAVASAGVPQTRRPVVSTAAVRRAANW
ncbi:hypothetical protein ACIBQX_11255 [Nonomuraea sp. NPDC049714]|uniref:hypothetical protein n=1 Tax=Nonomuraea sp. NPDC049714 TaxID=3364357 RepID=UPI0037ABE03B